MKNEKLKILNIQENISEKSELIEDAFLIFGPRIKRFASKKVGSIAADDIVSQTFLKLILYRTGFDKTKSKFTTWLHTIAYMECLQWIKNDIKYDRCNEINLHLSGNETLSIYRRYAGIDSNVPFQIKNLMMKEYDTSLDKLDIAKYKIKNDSKFIALKILLREEGDVTKTSMAKELGVSYSVLERMIDEERNVLLNIKKVRKKYERRKI